MRRQEKIRLIKALLLGSITYKNIKPPETEIWIQEIDADIFRNSNTNERLNELDLARRETHNENLTIIKLVFVEGKTIL
jgi:hypothetical protein